MSATTDQQQTDGTGKAGGFSAEERAAMKQRATELRTEQGDGLQAVLDQIAQMAPADRELAERVHATITTAAPELAPQTWYGMPAYCAGKDNVVVFFKDAGKFGQRYSTLGFEQAANLDDGEMWATSYALTTWTPAVEKKVAALVKAAVA